MQAQPATASTASNSQHSQQQPAQSAQQRSKRQKARHKYRAEYKTKCGLGRYTWRDKSKEKIEEEFIESLHREYQAKKEARKKTYRTSTRWKGLRKTQDFQQDREDGTIVDLPHSNGPGQAGRKFVKAEWSGIQRDPVSTTTGD